MSWGAMGVIEAVLEAAGLSDEGDTPDGQLSLRFNTCLGACSNGPVMSIDHRLVGRLSSDKAMELVTSLKEDHGHLLNRLLGDIAQLVLHGQQGGKGSNGSRFLGGQGPLYSVPKVFSGRCHRWPAVFVKFVTKSTVMVSHPKSVVQPW